jgi:hypothetical protein
METVNAGKRKMQMTKILKKVGESQFRVVRRVDYTK